MTLGDNTFVHKDSDNTVSIFSQGISIEKIKINDIKNPLEDINKAISSIQFLKENGLDILSKDIQGIIDIINQKQENTAGEKINIKNGIGTSE